MSITMRKTLFLLVCVFAMRISFGFTVALAQEQHQIDSIKTHNLTELNQEQLVDNFNALAYLFGGIDTDSSLYYSNKAIVLAKEIDFQKGLAVAYSYAARGFMQNGELKQAIENYNLALDLFTRQNDSVNMLDCYRGLSYVFSYGSSQLKSLEYNLKALDLAEALNDSASLSTVYNNIGTNYRNLDNYEGALRCFEKTLEIEMQLNDAEGLIIPYSNLGAFKVMHNKYEEASSDYKHVRNLLPTVVSDYLAAYMYLSLAGYYNAIGRYDSAQVYLDSALVISQEENYLQIQTRVFRQLGELRLNQKQYAESIGYFDQCLTLSDSIGIKEEFPSVYKKEALAYSKLGSFQKAYALSQKAIEAIDSLKTKSLSGFLEEFEQQIVSAELERKNLELALKDQQIANTTIRMQLRYQQAVAIIIFLILMFSFIVFFMLRMRYKNRRLKVQHELINNQKELLETNFKKLKLSEEILQKLNAGKDKFFSIIAHDLKSPFNAIIGFSDILSQDYNDLDDGQRKEMIGVVGDSAKATLALLDNLLTWARSQSGSIKINPEAYSLQQLVAEGLSANRPAAAMKNILINQDIPADVNVWVDKETTKVIISNLFNNAIKFSQNEGEIWLTCKLNNGMAEFCVRDSGIGMSEEIISGLFSVENDVQRVGTSDEKGTGLGLILCKEFVIKNGGDIWAKSIEGQGSEFYVSLPLVAE